MSSISITTLEQYKRRFVQDIPHTPTGRYASIVLLRETKSYSIFTTEGGEQQDVEQTQSGLTSQERMDRLVMFKRKQVAPERRTGKALLRQYDIFPYAILRDKKNKQVAKVAFGEAEVAATESEKKKTEEVKSYSDCYLTEGLCTHCPDCLTYGYAAIEGEGARKARVMTDSCFSVRPYPLIQKRINFNVIDEKTHTSGTITKYDYTVPSVFLPAVVTTVDLTANEFIYVLSNILRTSRYGKESTRQGTIRNHVLAVAFSDVELFANLELTQGLYDAFQADEDIDLTAGYLSLQNFENHIPQTINTLTADIAGRLELLQGNALDAFLEEVRQLNQNEDEFAAFLRDLTIQSASFVV